MSASSRLQGRALYGSTRQTSVIVCSLDQPPALVSLTFDEGFARLALLMQRVKILV
jgi:hypothetical protein